MLEARPVAADDTRVVLLVVAADVAAAVSTAHATFDAAGAAAFHNTARNPENTARPCGYIHIGCKIFTPHMHTMLYTYTYDYATSVSG